MIEADRDKLQQRVLVLSSTSKDASLTESVLAQAGIACLCCIDLEQLCEQLERGAGAVLVPEEAVQSGNGRLSAWLASQPPWSDMPVLVLARPGADSADVARAMDLLGNVTVLERPTRVAALVSALRSALRARQRQYEARVHLSQIEASEQRFRNIFQNAGVSLWEEDFSGVKATLDTLRVRGITDIRPYLEEHPDFVRAAMGAIRVLDVNDATIAMFEAKDKRELLGSLPKIFTPESMHVFVGELVAVAEGRTYFESEALLNTVQGHPKHVFFTMVMPRSGQPYNRVLFSVLDISARKRAEDLLKESDRRKDEFLAVLAHELRNPLAPIRNSLHIMRLTGPQDAATVRVGEMLERQVNHMVRLVDDLLEVSRITRGKIELRRELVEVAAIVRSAAETSRPLIEAAGHQLTLTVPSEPLTLDGDPVRLTQIVANLLNNAAKYTDAGGKIWLTARREADDVAIAVRDTGIGISPSLLPRAFELFTQIDRRADRAQGGLGIGLALAKSLVEMHGGSITAHSEGAGSGSEFVVRLPLAASGPPIDAPAKTSGLAADLAPRRVLVVDDNRDAADTMGMLLKVLGADVHVVYNGPDALKAFASYQPAVVLLDIGMPGMDGHEVARQMRRDARSQDVTLIALTGWGQPEDRERSQTAGFDYHLIKPADVSALESLLNSLESRTGTRRTSPVI